MEKRNKIVIGILTVLLVVVGIVAVYFAISANSVKENKDELKAQIEELTSKNTDLENNLNESNSKLDAIKDTLGVSDDTDTSSSTKAKSTLINYENCLNPVAKGTYSAFNGVVEDYSIASIGLDYKSKYSDDETSYCKVETTGAKIYFGNFDTTTSSEKYEAKNIEGIDKNIVYAGKYSYSDSDSALIFVLEDGTVNYLRFYNDIENGNFKSTKLNNVSNVVSIIVGNDGHSTTPLLITSDGKFYDGRQAIANNK